MKNTQYYNADTGDAGFGTHASPAPAGGESLIASSGAESRASAPSGILDDRGAFAEGWTARLPDELGEYRNGLGKFKTLGDFVKSYQGLEKMLGKSAQGTFVPNEDSTPEEISAYRRAIGVPESADGYQLKPEGLPDGLLWDDDTARAAAEIAHKYNVPPGAMREFVDMQMQIERGRVVAMQENIARQIEAGTQELQHYWGDRFDDRISKVKQLAHLAGVDPQSNGFLDPNMVRAFARISDLIGDDQFVGGSSAPRMNSAEQAKDIMTNPQNPLYTRYQEGDRDVVERVLGML